MNTLYSFPDIRCYTMNQRINYNCIVCAKECDIEELHNIVLSNINFSKFKICQSCLDSSDPTDDYQQARSIIKTYLIMSEAKQNFIKAQDILDDLK